MGAPVDELRRAAELGSSFAERYRAQTQLFRLGLGPDPLEDGHLHPELQRAEVGGVVAALADAGRTLLADSQWEAVAGWLTRLRPESEAERHAQAIVEALLAIRAGENEAALHRLLQVPDAEAVALHGIALLQLGDRARAAAQLEVLLAADALDERGEVPAVFLPTATPALELFLTACHATARAHLRGGRLAEARRHAGACRDAVRRYPEAELDEDLLEEIGDLLLEVEADAGD